MKKYITHFFENEILSYLFFGVATTVVAVLTRMLCYAYTSNELLATALGNIAGILFSFVTNDTIVFKQERKNWFSRFIKFVIARISTFLLDMGLTLIFVTTFPNIIGQFVHHDMKLINTIETLFAQIVIIVLNYVFSKIFVFKNKSKK
ncbi:GtrA family protein [Streptococcus intermedius]|uniref:GtrA family protein n=1 Tax=Streptococcus intermedius TaxID=1338 RepID=UPI00124E8966|nr:GtrA family protein [Streptococcus intermedius]